MKTLFRFTIFIIALSQGAKVNAQDLKYSQYFYSNPLKTNPAFLGMNTDLKAIINYRKQWGRVQNGYSTATMTLAYPLYFAENEQKIDFGLSALNDKFGAFNQLNIDLSIGYNLKISEASYLSFALIGGYSQMSLDQSSLTFDDQYVLGSFDATNTTSANITRNKLRYADVGFGLMWYMNDQNSKLNGYAGISTYHLNKPNQSFTGGEGALPILFGFQTGIKVKGKNSRLDFIPNVRYNYQANNQNLAIGSYFDFYFDESTKLRLGGWYRTSDAIALMLGFDHKFFMFAYSYDIMNSNMSNYVIGVNSHEITLAYKLNMAKKKDIGVAPSIF